MAALQFESGHSSSFTHSSALADDLPQLQVGGSNSAKAALRHLGAERLVYTEFRARPSAASLC